MRLNVCGTPAYAYTGGRPFEPDAPVVVFVHGAQNDHSVWILQSRYLAHHGRSVLAVDLPGHGRSEGPPLDSIAGMADWVLALIAASGATRAWIVGHSMGSLIAVEAAARAPGKVAGIALVGTAFPMKVSPALLEAAASDEPKAFDMINRWSYGGLAPHPGNPGPGFSEYWQGRRLMERQAPGVLLRDFAACDAYAGGEEAARAIRCPALFVLGDRDLMTPPRAARTLAAACAHAARSHGLPEPVVVTAPDAGHQVMAESPDVVREALAAFIPARA